MTELTPQTSRRDFLSQPILTQFVLDWEKTIYLIFLIVAIISRFWGLGDRVMSHDESLHTQFSFQYYDGNGYSHTPLMHGPFLFHATALSYWLFGDGDFAARVPVAILGILLVFSPLLFRQWVGRIGALFASFFFLISPYIVYYSRYIRHDIYVIVWAMMIVAAIWHYPLRRENKWLWVFTAGTALMFATKEVSFIYVAIFGSYLILRLLPQVFAAPWFGKVWPDLRIPILIVVAGVGLIGGGFVGHELVSREAETAVATEAEPTDEGFAADPATDTTAEVEAASSDLDRIMRWLGVIGLVVLSFGLFMIGNNMRPFIDAHPEFDFIVLFVVLVLPSISPLLSTIIGVNPLDYTINPCPVPGQEAMSSLQVFFAQLTTGSCYASFFSSPVILPALFLILTLVVAAAVGVWWDARRFLIAAAIFYAIFILLFTSLFTNPGGFASGAIGSLGYWLEQQEVQRGSQPWFYYFFVMPFYEFLPLLFSLLGIRLWFKQQRLNLVLGYFLFMGLLALVAFSFVNWLYNRPLLTAGLETSNLPGILVAVLIVLVGLLFWLFFRRRQIAAKYGLEGGLWSLFNREAVCEFMPFATWWLLITTVAYSYAGEKMPWLSTHFVIPMAFIAGWYFNEKLKGIDWQRINWQRAALLLGLSTLLTVIFFLALSPVLLGEIEFGNQLQANLSGIGRFLGGLLLLGGVLYLWNEAYARTERPLRRPSVILSVFLLLSLLTIRFSYMANFQNGDLTTEYLVYAHGAPATKEVVLTQLEELSMRLHGDKSIRVSFDNDVSWPYTWYLRDYPNRNYFGESPSSSLLESPIIIVGRRNWDIVEPYLGDEYSSQTYTFLWWPMEEYRQISWNALFGTPATPEAPRLGLLNPDVRHALWDIFFYRDYERYGEVYGGNYSLGEWPLRHELRLYIRNDVQAELWDYGVGSLALGGNSIGDPYAENELTLVPEFAINGAGFAGGEPDQLNAPRNVAVGQANGRIYVTDANSQQVKVFAPDGTFVTQFGEPGSGPGQFAAVPDGMWGIAVDEQFVYVADTWNHRIQKFTLDGDFVLSFGNSGAPDPAAGQDGGGLFFGPRDIALLSGNRLLVTDTGNHRLQMFDRDGNFISQTGGFGVLLGQLNEPVSVAVSPFDGSIFVTDTWNQRIQQFSPELFPLREWEIDAWDGQSINNKPYLAIDDAGRIYTSDPEGYRILIFDANGTYLGRFGRFGDDTGSFALPNGIALDANNNLVIADALNNRVVRYPAIFGPPAVDGILPLDEELEVPLDEEAVEEELMEEEEAAPAEAEQSADEGDDVGGEDDN